MFLSPKSRPKSWRVRGLLRYDSSVKGVDSWVLLIVKVVKENLQEFGAYNEDFKVTRKKEQGDQEEG